MKDHFDFPLQSMTNAFLLIVAASLLSSGCTSQPDDGPTVSVIPPDDRPSASIEPAAPDGMFWVEGGNFTMGWDGPEARPDEGPAHDVWVDGFWIDAAEVTNAQFGAFVEATGYVTTAERPPDWEDLKWTSDRFRPDTYALRLSRNNEQEFCVNPTGPPTTLDPRNPFASDSRVQKGGSFLCHADYCASYRPSAKMAAPPDSGMIHLGFRCVMTPTKSTSQSGQSTQVRTP